MLSDSGLLSAPLFLPVTRISVSHLAKGGPGDGSDKEWR